MKIYYLFIISISLFFLALTFILHINKLYRVTLVWGLINALIFPLFLSYFRPVTSILLFLIISLAGGRVIYTVYSRRQENIDRQMPESKQALEDVDQIKGGDVLKELTDEFPGMKEYADREAFPSGHDPADSKDADQSAESVTAEHAGFPFLPKKEPIPCLPLTTLEDRKEELICLLESNITVDELVSLYLRHREENNLLISVEYLQAAFTRADNPEIKMVLCADLVMIYRELGRYSEAGEFIASFLIENGHLLEPSVLEHFNKLIVYLKYLDKLLQKAALSGIPYSELPESTKMQAKNILRNEVIYL